MTTTMTRVPPSCTLAEESSRAKEKRGLRSSCGPRPSMRWPSRSACQGEREGQQCAAGYAIPCGQALGRIASFQDAWQRFRQQQAGGGASGGSHASVLSACRAFWEQLLFIPRPLRTFKMNSRSLFDMARSASRCMAAIAPTKRTETHHFRLQTVSESLPILPCTRAAGSQAFFATGCIQGLSCRSKHWIVFRKSNEGRLKASGTSKSCPAGRAPGATDRRPLSHSVRPICETSLHTLEGTAAGIPSACPPPPSLCWALPEQQTD